MNNSPSIHPIIHSTGVKPATSRIHEYMRRLLCLILIFIIIWGIFTEESEVIAIEDLEPSIKKDSLMYRTIQEMDGDAQQKYLRSLKQTLDQTEPSLLKKYSKSIKIALIAGLYSEYIINGNISKPIGIVAKTVVYSAISTAIAD